MVGGGGGGGGVNSSACTAAMAEKAMRFGRGERRRIKVFFYKPLSCSGGFGLVCFFSLSLSLSGSGTAGASLRNGASGEVGPTWHGTFRALPEVRVAGVGATWKREGAMVGWGGPRWWMGVVGDGLREGVWYPVPNLYPEGEQGCVNCDAKLNKNQLQTQNTESKIE